MDDDLVPALEAIDELLAPGTERLTQGEVAERAGIDLDWARRFWRAMGFPAVDLDEAVFTTDDLDAARALESILETGVIDREVALQMTRVMGQSMSRVAQSQVDAMRHRIEQGDVAEGTPEALARAAQPLLPSVEHFLVYQWRRHLAAAARRAAMAAAHAGEGDAGTTLTVGFADLVGFTALSQQLDEQDLAHLVDVFEQLALDTVTELRGRVVKMIGDEVMFVTDDPADAVEIGLALADAYGHDETMPDVRVGVAHGRVVGREADYFGPTVNLASRIVNISYAGSVIIASDVRDVLAEDERFTVRAIRPRRLKGIGITALWTVRRAGEATVRSLPSAVLDRMRARRGD